MAESNARPRVQTPPPDGLNTDKTRKPEIIVSLTSYPARMPFVPIVLNAMLNQTVKPDRVILWLDCDRFPNRVLPEWADMYSRAGVEFCFRADDIKPHTKYYYAIKENPDAIVILVDDDLYYENNTIEKLYNSYLKFPNAISALAVYRITFDRFNRMLRNLKWASVWGCNLVWNEPSMRTFFASGHGTLFPPGSLHPEVFNIEAFKRLCLHDDELWLRVMSILQGTPVIVAGDNSFRTAIPGSQVEGTLGHRGGLDGWFHREKWTAETFAAYNEFISGEDTIEKRLITMFQSENDCSFEEFYAKRGLHKRVVYTAAADGGYPLTAPSFITPDWDYICFTDCPELVSDFWQIRPLKCSFAEIRALPHKYLADYDYSLWIDPSYDIISDIDEIIVGHCSRRSLLCRYREDNLRVVPDTDILFRKHNDPGLILISESWWDETKKPRRIDALCLDYVCKKYNFSYDVYSAFIYSYLYFKQIGKDENG